MEQNVVAHPFKVLMDGCSPTYLDFWKTSAPPSDATELSTPDGLPCRIFSPTNAHELTR